MIQAPGIVEKLNSGSFEPDTQGNGQRVQWASLVSTMLNI